MRKMLCLLTLGSGALLGLPQAPAHAWGLAVGVGIGVPAYRPWGYYRPWCYGYRPYGVIVGVPPVVVEPAPVVVQPVPVIQPVPVVQPAPVGQPAPALQPVPAPSPTFRASGYASTPEAPAVEAKLRMLADVNENVRRDAAMDLGRLKADRAADPLAATLAGDRSPAVRDAAARALGLIGARRSLTALMYAAQADPDRDVRHSAQFAVEVIRSQLPHN